MRTNGFRTFVALSALALAGHCAQPAQPTRVFRDSFDGERPAHAWEAIRGDWAVADAGYSQRIPGKADYCYTVVSLPFDPVLVTVDATPTEKNSYHFASFGFVLKYVDARNWSVLRLGSYGAISLRQSEDGRRFTRRLGRLAPELGKTYQLAMMRRDGRVAVLLDGALQCVLHEPWPDKPGRIGLFTECACRFDNFEARSDRASLAAFAEAAAQRESAAALKAQVRIEQGVFQDTFDEPEFCQWRARRGSWRVGAGRYALSDRSFGRYMAVAPVLMAEGTIEGVAVPLAPSVQKTPRAVFGVVVKWIDSANWVAVRYGEYGGVAGLVMEAGSLRLRGMGEFTAEVGRAYRFRVETAGEQVTVYCDGQRLGHFDAPAASREGRAGLYTEAPTAFDDVRIHPSLPLVALQPDPFTGAPRLELAFCEFRAAPALPETAIPALASVRLYLRNTGSGPAYLHRLLIGGIDADHLTRTVGWHRQRPARLDPGGMAEVLIRLSALPTGVALELFNNPSAKLVLPITVEPRAGPALQVRVPVTTGPADFQINAVAFSPALSRLYAYVQQGPADAGSRQHVERILVNGRDLTSRSTFGRKALGQGVVPVVVDLQQPLRAGQPVVLCVGTAEGKWAGHAVRAFPGKFHIQVTLLGKQTRADAVEDIWRHCATCIGLCGASTDQLVKAKALGLAAFHYGRGGLGALRRFDKPQYPEIAGFWLDEMDRLPLRYTFDTVRECEAAYAKEGKFIPLQMINLCSSRSPQAAEYYEIGDACCGAYGYYGGRLGEQFGRVESVARRECRLVPLPFMPYFRDAEMPVVIDPQTDQVLGRCAKYRRCMEPREERWMTYGCLIQGAKGICHWNYGSGIRRPPNWFSKTDCAIRAGMGGALGHDPHGYPIPQDQAAELQRVWDEIGRINVELQAIGPLVAVSDVSHLARVTSVEPKLSPAGEPAAEAAALVSGLDSIVLVVLNHNIKTNWRADAERGIESYDPVRATVELRVPAWMAGRHVFRVRHTGVAQVPHKDLDGRMEFQFDALEVSEVVVVTDRAGLMESMARTVDRLRARLEQKRP